MAEQVGPYFIFSTEGGEKIPQYFPVVKISIGSIKTDLIVLIDGQPHLILSTSCVRREPYSRCRLELEALDTRKVVKKEYILKRENTTKLTVIFPLIHTYPCIDITNGTLTLMEEDGSAITYTPVILDPEMVKAFDSGLDVNVTFEMLLDHVDILWKISK